VSIRSSNGDRPSAAPDGDPSSGDPSSGDLSSGDPSSGDPSSGDPSSGDPLAGVDPALAKLIRHDIKTPLQAASLNLELLAMEQAGNVPVVEAIATIQASLDDAVAMLHRFDRPAG